MFWDCNAALFLLPFCESEWAQWASPARRSGLLPSLLAACLAFIWIRHSMTEWDKVNLMGGGCPGGTATATSACTCKYTKRAMAL